MVKANQGHPGPLRAAGRVRGQCRKLVLGLAGPTQEVGGLGG